MRNVIFSPLRTSLLTAMGVAISAACGTNVTVEQTGSSGAGASTSTSSGTGNSPNTLCVGATTINASDGSDSGFARCPDGTIHRATAESCDPTINLPACDATAQSASCASDADCTDGPNGKCSLFSTIDFDGMEYISCGCAYACTSDAECASGEVCICDGVVNPGSQGHAFCAEATCKTNADCASGECGLSAYDDGCSTYHSLACRSKDDVCRTEADCAEFEQCAVSYDTPGHWSCTTQNCAIGRPLLVDGQARTAPLSAGDAWARAAYQPDLGELSPTQRQALAEHWSEVARLEHASVASFARFILQLMAIGAPSELLRQAQQAMADEVEHAEMAFTLASAYAGRDVGPGPMDLSGTAPASDLGSVLVGLAREACVGETLGVAEALATAAETRDPALRQVLGRIADDELRHAGLAWKTLRWGLERADATVRAQVRAAMQAAMAEHAADPRLERAAAPEHGLLDAAAIGSIRRQALRDVVAPCAAAAFDALA